MVKDGPNISKYDPNITKYDTDIIKYGPNAGYTYIRTLPQYFDLLFLLRGQPAFYDTLFESCKIWIN